MRNAYFDQLDSIVDELVDMTQVVQVAVARATQALLTADAEIAERVISDDAAIDAARERVEERSFEGARRLEEDDEEMDQLRRSSFRLMLADSWPHGVEPAVDIALLGRYYERIADHAVSLARRVVYLVTGETVTTVDHL